MRPEPTTVPIATLLAQRDWVRRLARSLARDDASVDDLEQETWLAAMRRPPRHEGAARPWLRRVVRSLALNAHRTGRRRAEREQAGSRPEQVRAAADVVAEAEIHGRLVAAVLDLVEPYRSTVLMRFFEGAPPREIAKGMRVPVETVRTRLRRALANLREGLSKHGERPSWLATAAPFGAGWIDAGTGAGTTGAVGAGLAGGAVMTGKATVLAATTLALAAGFAGARLSGGAFGEAAPPDLAALTARIEALESVRGAGPDGPAPVEGLPVPVLAGVDPGEPSSDGTDLARRVRALEEALEATRHGNAALVAWASGLGPPPRDLEAEKKGLERLSDAELLEAIRKLSTAQYKSEEEKRVGLDRVILAAGAYLARNIEPSLRGEVLTIEGSAWLRLGEADKAEASLEEALRVVGASSREGHTATIQLAFVASHRKDNRRASQLMFDLARQPESAPGEHAYLRFVASTYLATVDAAGARAELRAMVDEFGGSEDPSTKHWVASARKELEKLESAEAGR